MRINRILLGMLRNRGIALPQSEDTSAPNAAVMEALAESDPGQTLYLVWQAEKASLDIRAVTLPTADGAAKLAYRQENLEGDGVRHVITILETSSYPATVSTALTGRSLDDVVRHRDINGHGFIITGAERLAAGGLRIGVRHPEGMLVEAQ